MTSPINPVTQKRRNHQQGLRQLVGKAPEEDRRVMLPVITAVAMEMEQQDLQRKADHSKVGAHRLSCTNTSSRTHLILTATGGGAAASAPSVATANSAGDTTLQGHHYAQTAGAGGAPSPLSMFLHLDPPKSAKTLNAKIHKEQIHPSVSRLALQYAEFKIAGANARCIAMLEAFKDVGTSLPVAVTANVAHFPFS